MDAALRKLATALMAAVVVTVSFGFLPERTHAKPIDDSYAMTCMALSRRAAELEADWNNAYVPESYVLREYREVLRQWYANGCDKTYGSLPKLAPRSKIDAANQTVAPGNQVFGPSN